MQLGDDRTRIDHGSILNILVVAEFAEEAASPTLLEWREIIGMLIVAKPQSDIGTVVDLDVFNRIEISHDGSCQQRIFERHFSRRPRAQYMNWTRFLSKKFANRREIRERRDQHAIGFGGLEECSGAIRGRQDHGLSMAPFGSVFARRIAHVETWKWLAITLASEHNRILWKTRSEGFGFVDFATRADFLATRDKGLNDCRSRA